MILNQKFHLISAIKGAIVVSVIWLLILTWIAKRLNDDLERCTSKIVEPMPYYYPNEYMY